jgi:HlyD family secretion protein
MDQQPPVDPPAVTRSRLADIVAGHRVILRAGALLAVGLLALLAWRLFSGGEPAPAAELPLVSVTAPQFHRVASRVAITGTIAARHELPLAIDGESGRIAAVLVDIGDRVVRGQRLLALDTGVLQPQVDRVAAAVEQARAEAALAAADWRRAQGLAPSGALSEELLEQRRTRLTAAGAAAEAAAAQLAEMRARLARMTLRAPADGVILTRTAEVGQIVQPGGAPLLRMAERGEIELRGQAAEQDLPLLAVGQPAVVRLGGVERDYQGHVRMLGAAIDPLTRLGEVRITLPVDPHLRPGAFARAAVTVADAERAMLPQTAVLSDAQGNYVFVVGSDDRVARRGVTIADTQPDGVVIDGGLNPQDRVVVRAGAFLRTGERVRAVTTAMARPPDR